MSETERVDTAVHVLLQSAAATLREAELQAIKARGAVEVIQSYIERTYNLTGSDVVNVDGTITRGAA